MFIFDCESRCHEHRWTSRTLIIPARMYCNCAHSTPPCCLCYGNPACAVQFFLGGALPSPPFFTCRLFLSRWGVRTEHTSHSLHLELSQTFRTKTSLLDPPPSPGGGISSKTEIDAFFGRKISRTNNLLQKVSVYRRIFMNGFVFRALPLQRYLRECDCKSFCPKWRAWQNVEVNKDFLT